MSVISYRLSIFTSFKQNKGKINMAMTLEEIKAKIDLLHKEIENWKPKSDSFLKEIETWKQPNLKEKGKANNV